MIYFIPSWQSMSNGPTDFDDIVHQLRTFQESDVEFELIIPVYLPNIRYQLNRQGLDDIKYWSVFDELQISNSNVVGLPTKLENLKFPDNARFIYTPSCVIIYVQNKLYAKVFFSEFGFIASVTYFFQNRKIRQAVFDERSFLSSCIFFDKDENVKNVNYFDAQHNVKIEYNLINNQTVCFENGTHQLYQNLDNLILEKIEEHIRSNSQYKTLIISASKENTYLTQLSKCVDKTLISFFDQRFNINNENDLVQYTKIANIMVVDTLFQRKRLEEKLQQLGLESHITKINEIPPFDTRLKLGESQSSPYQKIYWYLNEMDQTSIEKVAHLLVTEISERERLSILIASKENAKIELVMAQMFRKIKDHFDIDEDSLVYQTVFKKINDESENKLTNTEFSGLDETSEWKDANDAITTMQRLQGVLITSENDVVNGLRDTRIVLDLNSAPDVFVQLSAISVGIPQVNVTHSEYVIDKQNGLLIDEIINLKDALSYYLDDLYHWNESLVYNVALMEKYSGKQNIQRWIELIRG
ncbi:accessory Sec system protein Asp1 [Leuconostoc palmae]|uniref:accessory Sec system protein Asp1 n=1 Tax=Leuconostoc palmae TaxID=501487 RepID=UPI001FEB53E1|nr:accessory Sec system protein Asp1 [Leuconostoc palmae]